MAQPNLIRIVVSTVLAASILISWTQPAEAERILFIFPLSSKSMSNIFEPLVKGLTQRGHELTLVSPVRFDIPSQNVTHVIAFSADEIIRDYPDPFEIRKQNQLYHFPVSLIENKCHKLYQLEQFRKLAKEKFDLIIVNILFQDCFAGVMHQIGSPIIFMSTLPPPSVMTEFMGNYFPSSFLPIFALGDFSATLSFKQRVKNFLYNAYVSILFERMKHPHMENIYRNYLGQDIPSIDDIYQKQASMIFLNSHYSLTFPRPLLPSIMEIGGIHCHPGKPLWKDLEEFVSGAKDGFILFSLGSIVQPSRMPESVRKAFMSTFSNLTQRVIWKWDKEDEMPDTPANVKLVKWLPQQDLLAHPNIRLFITHGGLLSTEEAVYHGVPVIGMPVFVDQDANMRQAELLGIGLKGEILGLTEDKLTLLVRQILDDSRYSEKAKELSKLFRDQPHTSLEKAIFWTEYVMRHKGAYHLRSSSMNLNLIQYHSIDVVMFLVVIAVVLLYFSYRAVKMLVFAVTPSITDQKRVDKLKKYL